MLQSVSICDKDLRYYPALFMVMSPAAVARSFYTMVKST